MDPTTLTLVVLPPLPIKRVYVSYISALIPFVVIFEPISMFFLCCFLFTTVICSIHVLNSPWKTFEKVYKGIWANNADAISIGYAGTGALKVDFTKTGKRTVKGMINDGVNSCIRYYVNNFTDGMRNHDNIPFFSVC